MKIRTIPGIGLAIALSSSSWAEQPLDPAQVGNFDGMLSVCREVNPAGSSLYNSLREAMLGEQPEGAVDALSQTPEYRGAYEAARQKSEAEPREKVLKECTELAAMLSPLAHQHKKHK